MPKFIIKTHRKEVVYPGNQIYILNKGLNSGKPQKEPFTNSFVIIFQNEEDAEAVYWLAYSLWKVKFWHQYLCGSVIPFLRINDLKKELNYKVNSVMLENESHQKNIAALKLLDLKEKQIQQNLNLISDIRKSIVFRY